MLFIDSPMRWFRSALSLLVALCSIIALSAPGTCAASVTPADISFDYKLAWVDVESSTFGVSLQASPKPSYDSSSEWSLILRYNENAKATIAQISDGWKLGIVDHASWALMPGSAPFDPLFLTVHSSGQMNLEDTVVKLAEPAHIYLVPTAVPVRSTSTYLLKNGEDFQVNSGVNLAQIPKKAYGPWLSLRSASATNIMDNTQTASRGVSSSSARQSRPTLSSTDSTKASSTQDPKESPTATATTGESATATATATAAQATMVQKPEAGRDAVETHLPPPKYIKGDPNYDPNANPLGTQLVGSHLGLYLVSSIIGVGLVAHIVGTLRRFQFQRRYHSSIKRSKAGLGFA